MDRPLRVAVTLEQCWHAVPGGTARAALESVRALVAHSDLDLVGVSARHAAPPPAAWTPVIPVEALPLPRLALYEAWHWLRRPAVERATGRVDVIHATGMAVPPPSAPIVVTVHDLAFLRNPGQFTRRGVSFFRRAIELARRDATLVMCPSQATLDDCARNGFDPARLRLVPWGIEAEPAGDPAVAEVRARFGIPGRYVLWTGTIEPRKNLPTLLDAFERLGRTDIQLVLAGPQGWNEDLGERLTRLGDLVRPVGFVDPDALRALYAGADVFCFPSLEEGFGLPVLEAMAQGTAVVTSAGTATAEVAGDTGILVDPLDVVGLSEALARLLDDDDERERLGAAGRARATERFSWAHTAAALEAVLTEAAA
jgi:glycosyltransferase involved in cell wall biosynthesis